MEETLQALQGTVARVIYENSETGYTVFELAADGELHAVAGTIGEVHEGESVTVYGTFGEHKTYGFQFQAQSCETAVPQDLTALQVYLSSGALPYIGAATARKIIDRFGMQTLDIIASDPEQLTFIRGITSEKARAIQHEFQRMFGGAGGHYLAGPLRYLAFPGGGGVPAPGPCHSGCPDAESLPALRGTAADAFYPGG